MCLCLSGASRMAYGFGIEERSIREIGNCAAGGSGGFRKTGALLAGSYYLLVGRIQHRRHGAMMLTILPAADRQVAFSSF